MIIKIKYSIGDEVWCNIYGGIKVKINSVIVRVSPDGNYIADYTIIMDGIAWCREENELFLTEEELLKSLVEK